jgi:hypothetical protein
MATMECGEFVAERALSLEARILAAMSRTANQRLKSSVLPSRAGRKDYGLFLDEKPHAGYDRRDVNPDEAKSEIKPSCALSACSRERWGQRPRGDNARSVQLDARGTGCHNRNALHRSAERDSDTEIRVPRGCHGESVLTVSEGIRSHRPGGTVAS